MQFTHDADVFLFVFVDKCSCDAVFLFRLALIVERRDKAV